MRTYLSSLQLILSLVAAVKRLPVHHYSADYICVPFLIVEFIFTYLEIEFHSLGGVAGVAHLITGREQTQ